MLYIRKNKRGNRLLVLYLNDFPNKSLGFFFPVVLQYLLTGPHLVGEHCSQHIQVI